MSFSLISENANDALKGRILELSLADLNKDEEQAFRKIKLKVGGIGWLRAGYAAYTPLSCLGR